MHIFCALRLTRASTVEAGLYISRIILGIMLDTVFWVYNSMVQNKHKISLLVVHASASYRSVIINMLRDQGFCHFDQAPDGVEAFHVLKKRSVDVILSGMEMPEMNGMSLLKVVSADENLYRLPFLLLTHTMNREMVLEAGRCGVACILIEPVTYQVLKEKMSGIMGGPADKKEKETEKLFASALKLTEGGDYNKALSLCEEILEKEEDAEVYYNIGHIKTYQKKYDEALLAFRKAVMIDNLYARAYKMMGAVYAKKGDTKKAQHFFEKAGNIFLERNMDNEAEEAFSEVIKINPDTVNIYNSLGIIYRKRKDFKGAVNQYQKALKVDPDDENILYNIGRAYLEDKDVENAKKTFEQALSVDPDFKEAKKMLQAIEVGF